MSVRLLPLPLLALGLIAGCALQAPPPADEVRAQALPGVQAPGQWLAGEVDSGAVAGGWLGTFSDPQLDALVAEALAHNPDLQVAAARVEQAAAYVGVAAAGLYPQLRAAGSTSGKASDAGTVDFGGLFARWELDLWGKLRAGRESAKLQLLSAELTNEYARQSLAAMVARSWFLAIEASQQRQLANDAVKSAEALVQLAQERQRVGVGTEYDVATAQAGLLRYRDLAQQVDLTWQQSVQALETLLGRYPGAELQVAAALPAWPGPVPVGLPSELLERRPDVIAAERRVAAAFYRVEEAKLARLPTISLTAGLSTLSSDMVLLKQRDDWELGYGGSAVLPIYLGGSLQSQIEVRTAEQKEAVAEYGRAGAAAFSDVERALSAGFALDAREPLLSSAVAENKRALALAETRFRVGRDDLRVVQQQQLQLYDARSSLLRVQSERLVQRVNLHLALGGGF